MLFGLDIFRGEAKGNHNLWIGFKQMQVILTSVICFVRLTTPSSVDLQAFDQAVTIGLGMTKAVMPNLLIAASMNSRTDWTSFRAVVYSSLSIPGSASAAFMLSPTS